MNHLISLAAYRAHLAIRECDPGKSPTGDTCGEAMRALGAHGMRCPVTVARADALDEALAAQKRLNEERCT